MVNDEKPYRELTLLSLVTAVIVGAVLNMGICYAGMQIGFTIVGSAVAAVIKAEATSDGVQGGRRAERQLARVWSMTTDGFMHQSLVDLVSARKQLEHACEMADQI